MLPLPVLQFQLQIMISRKSQGCIAKSTGRSATFQVGSQHEPSWQLSVDPSADGFGKKQAAFFCHRMIWIFQAQRNVNWQEASKCKLYRTLQPFPLSVPTLAPAKVLNCVAMATLIGQLPVWIAATLATWAICWTVVSPEACQDSPACNKHLKTYPGSLTEKYCKILKIIFLAHLFWVESTLWLVMQLALCEATTTSCPLLLCLPWLGMKFVALLQHIWALNKRKLWSHTWRAGACSLASYLGNVASQHSFINL